MSPGKEDACKDGLTPECFEEFPEFARQLFFLRLLYLLFPAQVSFKLPAKFRDLIFRPGPVFPPGWRYGDPWPDQAFTWEGLNMPPYDLLPYHLTLPSDLSEDVQNTGPLPLFGLSPSAFALPGAPVGARGKISAYLFYDDFSILDTSQWTFYKFGSGNLDIVSGRLRIQKPSDSGHISVTRADPKALLSNFSITFKLQFISGTSFLRFDYWTGVYYVYIRFQLPDILKIWSGSAWQFVTLADFTDIEYTWRFRIDWRGCYVFRDGYEVATALTVPSDTTPSGTHRFVLEDTGNLRIDDFRLTGI